MKRTIIALALSSCFSVSVSADPQEGIPDRKRSTGVLPVVEGAGSLTVSGGEYWHKEIYEDGEQPSIVAYDDSGQMLPDGHYRYEFKSSPNTPASDAVSPGNSAFGLSKAKGQRGEIARGQFEISGGEIIFR